MEARERGRLMRAGMNLGIAIANRYLMARYVLGRLGLMLYVWYADIGNVQMIACDVR
jgi:hypothetical protein